LFHVSLIVLCALHRRIQRGRSRWPSFCRETHRLPRRGIIAVLVAFFLAFAIDGSNSYLYLLKQAGPGMLDQIPNLYVPNNTLRLFTGSGMGIAMAAMLFPVVNQTLWREADDRPALEWKTLAILAGIVLIADFAILTESPIVLYPVAILSVLGVLALLTMVFTIVWIISCGGELLYGCRAFVALAGRPDTHIAAHPEHRSAPLSTATWCFRAWVIFAWKRYRRLLAFAFRRRGLNAYIPLLVE
jgi:hypothetical protein